MIKYSDLSDVISRTQHYFTKNYTALIDNKNITEAEIMTKNYIKKYIEDENFNVENYKTDELVIRIYEEMAEFGLLSKYLKDNTVEEININSWEDIKITYENGDVIRSKEKFTSPKHATDIVKRLLQKSNMIMDNSNPIVVGHLSNKIRITAINKGIVDENIGVSCSIRIVNPKQFEKKDFIENETASEEMIDFLVDAHKYGASICFTGATGSGKTTLMGFILSQLPNNKRIFTIENHTREFNLIKKDKDGNVINNVIHTITKEHEDKDKRITMSKLLETALTVNPDYICVAEMKSDEAFYAQEAARSGHAVTTTIHANSCVATYHRMVTLCKQKYDLADDLLYKLVTEAFPIVVFTKKTDDNKRRVMEITECVINNNGVRDINTLYKFVADETIFDETGKVKIKGKYLKGKNISDNLLKLLIENGLDKNNIYKN